MRLIYCLLGFVFCSSAVFAQTQPVIRCGTMQALERRLKEDPSLKDRINAKRAEALARMPQYKQSQTTTDTSELIIPVVVHVVYHASVENISDAQVESQIDILNQDFGRENADSVNTPSPFVTVAGRMKIRFQLANVDPWGASTTGITRTYTSRTTGFYDDDSVKFTNRRGTDAWPTKSYMNLWVCKMEANLLGYGQFPDVPDTLTDGVVINYECFGNTGTVLPPFNKGRTLTHELGHWLNLYHTWGDSFCGDDFVDDTPVQQSASFGCPTFPHYSCGNDTSGLHSGDMFTNYMDYSDDACMNIFTKGQVERMLSAFNTYRIKLKDSKGLGIYSLNNREIAHLTIYPNPLSGSQLNVVISSPVVANAKIVITDVIGIKVFESNLSTGSGSELVSIQIPHLAMGLYNLQLIQGQSLIGYSKLVIKD